MRQLVRAVALGLPPRAERPFSPWTRWQERKLERVPDDRAVRVRGDRPVSTDRHPGDWPRHGPSLKAQTKGKITICSHLSDRLELLRHPFEQAVQLRQIFDELRWRRDGGEAACGLLELLSERLHACIPNAQGPIAEPVGEVGIRRKRTQQVQLRHATR